MKPANLEQSSDKNIEESIDFHGASIVTTAGKEIPITEQMLEHSFKVLIDAWENARRSRKR